MAKLSDEQKNSLVELYNDIVLGNSDAGSFAELIWRLLDAAERAIVERAAEHVPTCSFVTGRANCSCGNAVADGVTRYKKLWAEHLRAALLPAAAQTQEAPPKPTRRQVVFNWLMGEHNLRQKDGYWGGAEEVAHIDELLAALDATAPKPPDNEREIEKLEARLDEAREIRKKVSAFHNDSVGRYFESHINALDEALAALRRAGDSK